MRPAACITKSTAKKGPKIENILSELLDFHYSPFYLAARYPQSAHQRRTALNAYLLPHRSILWSRARSLARRPTAEAQHSRFNTRSQLWTLPACGTVFSPPSTRIRQLDSRPSSISNMCVRQVHVVPDSDTDNSLGRGKAWLHRCLIEHPRGRAGGRCAIIE
jgi:hypothetical protein